MKIIYELYREYYRYAINSNILEVPDQIRYREIAYGYKNKVDNRNLSFKSEEEYKRWVLKNTPFHLYKSLAYMRYPSNSGAKNKEIFRRELAFDIDVHKTESCEHGDDWICKHCLNLAKKQAQYLIDEFLFPDFGLEEEDIKIVFSGNRGYHIYLKPRDENVRETIEKYGKEERRLILNYILGKNLSLNNINSAWRRRIIKELRKYKISIKGLKNERNWNKILSKREDKKRIINIIEKVKKFLEIDEKVMEDDIRLLRVINSLHGYTGFIVKDLTYKELKKFNPLKDAIFKNFENKSFKIEIKEEIDKIKINNKTYSSKSKKVSGTALLFLYGHGVKFNLIS
ncbi:DNA primase catalytic subunit PriS [Methanocaldococcus sp.]